MDWGLVASAIAALAALAAAIAQIARSAGDFVWYRRWAEVLEHASGDDQRAIASERIGHYVVELAVADRTRKRRRAGLALAILLVAASLGTTVASAWWFVQLEAAGGWTFALIAGAAYVLGTYLLVFFPDQRRDHARRAITGEAAERTPPVRTRWRLPRHRHARS